MPQCNLCNNNFPFRVEIDGKIRNLKNRKYCINCSPFGSKNTKQLHTKKDKKILTHKTCTRCNVEKELNCDNFYKRKDGKGGGFSAYCRKCLSEISIEGQRQRKQWAIDYKGGSCQKCGYDRYIGALEFHHLDPSEKDYEPARLFGQNKSYDIIKRELDKCILVCANCHREIHWEIKSQAIKDKDIMTQYGRNDWPNSEELKKLVFEKPMPELSKQLNVSHNALREKLKRENITMPPKGYWSKKKEK